MCDILGFLQLAGPCHVSCCVRHQATVICDLFERSELEELLEAANEIEAYIILHANDGRTRNRRLDQPSKAYLPTTGLIRTASTLVHGTGTQLAPGLSLQAVASLLCLVL